MTAKSEFPLRSVEDVPFLNVYEQEDDEVPFDISDIIADRKARSCLLYTSFHRHLKIQFYSYFSPFSYNFIVLKMKGKVIDNIATNLKA